MRLAASYDRAAGTTAPPGAVSWNAIVACWTASLNSAVASAPTETPVAPGAGVRALSVGLVVSVSWKTTSTQ